MKKRLTIFLFLLLGIFYIGSGLYFYKKSISRNKKIVKPVIAHSPSPSDLIVMKDVFTDFEDESSAKRYTVVNQKSFSGKRSVKIGGETEFGGEIIQSFSEIPYLNNLREVEVSMKYWNERINDGVIWVLEVDGQDGKVISWEGDMMPDTLNKWCSYSKRFKIKEEFLKNFNRIKTYAWNKNHSIIYIDDLQVRFKGLEQVYNSAVITNNIRQTSFHYDLENDTGLINEYTITDELSFSGKHSSVIKGSDNTSVMICKKFEDVVMDTLRNLTASVWIYPMTDNVNCVFTLEVKTSDGDQIYWNGKSTEKMKLKAKQWQKLNSLFNIEPDDYSKFNPDDQVCIYILNNSDTKVYTDDFDVSFGPIPPKPGVQTFVDMNALQGRAYDYARYHPPFKKSLLQRKEIHNDDSPFLVKTTEVSQCNFDPYQIYLTGNFSGKAKSYDELLSISTNEITLCHYCESAQRFVIDGTMPFNRNEYPFDTVTSGDYNGDGKNEILLLSSNTSSLIEISSSPTCSDNIHGISIKEIWKGNLDCKNKKIFSGNYSASRNDEILLVGKKGNLLLEEFEGGIWKTLSDVNIPANVFGDTSTSVSMRYSSSSNEQILSIYSENKIMKGRLISFENNKLKIEPVPDESSLFNFFAVDDKLFPIHLKNKNTEDLLSNNTRWRFELKNISHDNKGFYVSSVSDFAGFTGDQNPKYYEIVRILPGNFTGNETSLLCILRNCADKNFDGKNCQSYESLQDLPNRIQLYYFSK